MDVTRALFFFFPMIFVFGGLGFLYFAVRARIKDREMLHRERLALIERGLVPPPETDPARFHRVMVMGGLRLTGRGVRYRSAGIIIIGFGLALMTLLTFTAGEPQIGMGVGGAFAILGAAFVVISLLEGPDGVSGPAPPLAGPDQTPTSRGGPPPASTSP